MVLAFILALAFLFAGIFAAVLTLHVVLIGCLSVFYFLSPRGVDPFDSPLAVFALCATVAFLFVALALTFGRLFLRLYSRLAALTLRNDNLPPPLPR
jgi:hypothetical protein